MTFLTKRDGYEPQELYPHFRFWQRFRQPFFSIVSLPFWLSKWQGRRFAQSAVIKNKTPGDPERTKFVVRVLIKYLQRLLAQVKPRATRKSVWVDYVRRDLPYSAQEFQAKNNFVSQVLQEFKPTRVLDIGCNTGHFSCLAAELGSEVVAIDRDEVSIAKLWTEARKKKLDILPLVVDILRPTPAVGWCNRETSGFLERCQGNFDLTLWLALVHHLIYGDGIPLDAVVELIAGLSSKHAIVEFMMPSDISVQMMMAQRRNASELIDSERFEQALQVKFDIIRSSSSVGSHRAMYLLAKKA